MQELIEFIERYAIDPRVYLVAPCCASPRRLELQWERSRAVRRWRVRWHGAATWTECDAKDLEAQLARFDADLENVTTQLRAVALTQVVFAEAVRAEGNALFGSALVERAVAEHAQFLDELRAIVLELTGRRWSALDGGGQASEARRGHLSLVPRGREQLGPPERWVEGSQ